MPLLSKQCGLQLLPLVDILRRGRAARFPALGPEIFLIERKGRALPPFYADWFLQQPCGLALILFAAPTIDAAPVCLPLPQIQHIADKCQDLIHGIFRFRIEGIIHSKGMRHSLSKGEMPMDIKEGGLLPNARFQIRRCGCFNMIIPITFLLSSSFFAAWNQQKILTSACPFPSTAARRLSLIWSYNFINECKIARCSGKNVLLRLWFSHRLYGFTLLVSDRICIIIC